jgi:hypothetical protein|eukprot:evm.model.NODE_18146_length_9227_cov_20.338572.1
MSETRCAEEEAEANGTGEDDGDSNLKSRSIVPPFTLPPPLALLLAVVLLLLPVLASLLLLVAWTAAAAAAAAADTAAVTRFCRRACIAAFSFL